MIHFSGTFANIDPAQLGEKNSVIVGASERQAHKEFYKLGEQMLDQFTSKLSDEIDDPVLLIKDSDAEKATLVVGDPQKSSLTSRLADIMVHSFLQGKGLVSGQDYEAHQSPKEDPKGAEVWDV